MAPPFSGDDPDDQDRPPRRSQPPSSPWSSTTTRGRRRGSGSDPFRSYAHNALATHPELLLPDPNESKRKDSYSSKTDVSKDEGVEDKYKFVNRYEQQRNINKVTFEVPLVFSTCSTSTSGQEAMEQSTKSTSPTLKLSEDARLSMFSHVPPSTPDGRWTASISGNSKVHQVIGCSNASAEISYKASNQTRLVGGVDMMSTAISSKNDIHTSRPLQLRLGAQYCENNKQASSPSMMQVTVRQCGSHKNSWGIAVNTRDVMDPWIVTSNFWWHPLTRQWKTILSFSSMTTHVLRLGIGWGSSTSSNAMDNATPWVLPLSLFQLSVDPKLSTNRRLPVSIQYHPTNGAWNANATMLTTQPPSSLTSSTKNGSTNYSNKTSSWRVGIHRASSSSTSSSLAARWTIIVAWQRGDITLRIPILILGTAMAASSSSTESNNGDQQDSLLVATAAPFLVCAIVGVAHEMISRLIWGDDMFFNANIQSKSPEPTTTTATNRSTALSAAQIKAKQDALSQQNLMTRQAEARKAAEQEKNGLVIESAAYQLVDNNQTESNDTTDTTAGANSDAYLNVTIPLQFWVAESRLTLAAGSKQHLLGFYPLATTSNAAEASSATGKLISDGNNNDPAHTFPWWKEYWTPLKDRRGKIQSKGKNSGANRSNPTRTLTVHYSYQGVSLKKTIRDDQALSLPEINGESDE